MTDINHQQFEEIALINFIGASTTGPILKAIAERRLAEIQNPNKKAKEFSHDNRSYKSIACQNIITGEFFDSIRQAAKSMRVAESSLGKDISLQVYNYPIRKLIF